MEKNYKNTILVENWLDRLSLIEKENNVFNVHLYCGGTDEGLCIEDIPRVKIEEMLNILKNALN